MFLMRVTRVHKPLFNLYHPNKRKQTDGTLGIILGCNTVYEHLYIYQLLFILCISCFRCGHKKSQATQKWQRIPRLGSDQGNNCGEKDDHLAIFASNKVWNIPPASVSLLNWKKTTPTLLFPLNANLKKIQYGIFFIQFQFRFIKYDVSSEGAVMVIFNS